MLKRFISKLSSVYYSPQNKFISSLEAIIKSKEAILQRNRNLKQNEKELLEVIERVNSAYNKTINDINLLKNIINKEKELRNTATAELQKMEQLLASSEDEAVTEISKYLYGNNDIFIELKPGVGGEDASLFCRDLYNLYKKYSEHSNWEVEDIEVLLNEASGIKKAVLKVNGRNIYPLMMAESGVHRLIRVSPTKKSSVHTSTVCVCVRECPSKFEFELKPKDLRIDNFRPSKPGGQNMQKSQNGVRIHHIPSGITVTVSRHRTYHENLKLAKNTLYAKMMELNEDSIKDESDRIRSKHFGQGNFYERIRTYSYVLRNVMDHRIGGKGFPVSEKHILSNENLYALQMAFLSNDILDKIEKLVEEQN